MLRALAGGRLICIKREAFIAAVAVLQKKSHKGGVIGWKRPPGEGFQPIPADFGAGSDDLAGDQDVFVV
jgi:hypothetical protein